MFADVSSSDVTLDHFVPLAHAHRAGAWEWTSATKASFSNDLGFAGTLKVAGSSTNQSKGMSGPEDWRPPLRAAWCTYAIDWIGVKDRWNLVVRTAEVAALNTMLDTCIGDEMVDTWPPSKAQTADATATNPQPPPTTLTPASSPTGCHPSYIPCLDRPGDYDCIGGTGNGPNYTGRVSVIGPDEYRLDADRDGIGCEGS